MLKRNNIILLFVIFILAFLIRVYFLKDFGLTFGYDQARDALSALQIVHGHLKILGPSASTPGLYHGVFYYYILAPAYLFGKGSPIIAAYWIAFLSCLTVFTVYYLTFLFTKKVGAGLLAALLFACSFEASQYATWMSNPTLGVWTVPLIYLGSWIWFKERNKWGAIIAGIGLGLSIQAEIFLAFHAAPLFIWYWVAKSKVKRQEIGLFLVALFASLSTMVLAEIKFGFKSIQGLSQLAVASDSIVLSRGLGDFIILFFNQLGKVFANNAYPGNIGYGGVFVLVLIVISLYSWKKKEMSWQPFIASWLLAHITVVSVGGTSTPFLLVGIGPAVSILIAIYIYKWWESRQKMVAIAILFIVIFGNLAMIFKENFKGQTIFAIQKDMVLAKQLQAIDYTYAESQGKPFSINSLTSPLWINIVWTYLYKWYGEEKYGYIPEWHGHDQIGQLDTLPVTNKDTKQYFLILEPLEGIPAHFLPDTVAEEDGFSKLVNEKSFGSIVVQKRERIDSK